MILLTFVDIFCILSTEKTERPCTPKNKIVKTGFGLLLLLIFCQDLSLANYNLNFADSNSFSITCGKLTSWWSVKNDSCQLMTTFMRCEVESTNLTCNFRLNQSGNLDLTDNAYIQYQINDGGWVTDTCVSGYGLDAVWFRSFPLALYYGDYIQFRVIYETNDQTEFWGLQNDDISISGDFVIYPTPPGPLPVEFTSVSCEQSFNSIIINWQTASETNNDYFTIERSENGVDFYVVGYAAGAGNSNSVINYQYSNDNPINGINFYRIRQTDYDGKYSYSDIISILLMNKVDNITPSNQNGYVSINFFDNKDSYISINAYDICGKLVINETHFVSEGYNKIDLRTPLTIRSIYIIYLLWDDGKNHSLKQYIQ